MNRFKKIVVTALTVITGAGSIFAATPQFSMKMNGAIGAYNISNNPTVKEIPGLSDNSKLDFSFGLKGSFGNDASYKSVGYNSGAYIDLDALWRNPLKGDGYVSPDSKKTTNYSKIQKMIDWYEANKHRYGLPDNPFGDAWPTTSYGSGNFSVPFINGTQVEDANDVNWSETGDNTWVAANALYQDVYNAIHDAIINLYLDHNQKADSKITQMEFDAMTAEEKQYALLKMEALNSFSALATEHYSKSPVSGFAEFTNIANLFDIRLNIANSRLSAGKLISSERTGQNAYGSSVKFGINRNVVPGLDVALTVGVAGGTAARPENWDTQALDYMPGKYSELAVKLNADYTYEFTDLKLALTAGMDFIMPDLLVSSTNNAGAFRVGVHWNDHREYINEYGFYLVEPKEIRNLIEVKDNFEFTYTYSKDHYDLFDEPSFAYAMKNELYASGYGAELRFDTSYKNNHFENKYENQVEDRFYGRSIESDFHSANLRDAVLLNLDLAFNTLRAFDLNILTLNGGFDNLLYDGVLIGSGWHAGLAINLIDYVKSDLIFSADISNYMCGKVKTFTDMEDLPVKQFLDYTTIKAGIEYEPYRNYRVGLNFISAPSTSRRHMERLTSAEVVFNIKY